MSIDSVEVVTVDSYDEAHRKNFGGPSGWAGTPGDQGIDDAEGSPEVVSSDQCSMNDPKWNQCCCSCIYHKETHHHCTTNWDLRSQLDKCICGVVNGYACCVHEGRIHINWPKHSPGCECFVKKEIKTEEEISQELF